MLIRKLSEIDEITAGDNAKLKELLHPDKDYPFSGRYSLAYAILPVGEKSLKHRLKSDEVYYILKGRGLMQINDEEAEVTAGDTIDIPPGSIQSIKNIGETEIHFLCIVDRAWKIDDEEIIID